MAMSKNTPEHQFFMSASQWCAIAVFAVIEITLFIATAATGFLAWPIAIMVFVAILIIATVVVLMLRRSTKYIDRKDMRVQQSTEFIKDARLRVEKLIIGLEDKEAEAVASLSDKLRYTDSISTESTTSVDSQLSVLLAKLEEAKAAGSGSDVIEHALKAVEVVEIREGICRSVK